MPSFFSVEFHPDKGGTSKHLVVLGMNFLLRLVNLPFVEASATARRIKILFNKAGINVSIFSAHSKRGAGINQN